MGGEAQRRRILLVEDNVDTAESFSEYLSCLGHEVRVAHDGVAGLALAREFRPQVGVFDLGLPGMSGFALARAIRSEASLGELYLVALSAYTSREDRALAREAGFDLHLAKPVMLEQLAAALDGKPAS
jgi:DNA-binding response OmpR family regulator